MIADPNIELGVRRARMRAAKADPARTTADWIAAMAAGSGAELVARHERARMILEEGMTRHAERQRRSRGA